MAKTCAGKLFLSRRTWRYKSTHPANGLQLSRNTRRESSEVSRKKNNISSCSLFPPGILVGWLFASNDTQDTLACDTVVLAGKMSSLSLASTCSSRAIFLGVGEPVGSQMMQPATSWRGSATIDWLSFTCYHIRIHACITTRGISLSPECLALLFDCTSFQLLDCTQHPSSDIPPPTLMHSPTKAQ